MAKGLEDWLEFQTGRQGNNAGSCLRDFAIIGVGGTQLRPSTPEVSYKELIFEAAVKPYEDAGLDPRRDVQSFVC